ncbi:hypothetical protein, partial [Mycolicibacterium fortuitum]
MIELRARTPNGSSGQNFFAIRAPTADDATPPKQHTPPEDTAAARGEEGGCRLPICVSFFRASARYNRGIAIEMSAEFCHLNVES